MKHFFKLVCIASYMIVVSACSHSTKPTGTLKHQIVGFPGVEKMRKTIEELLPC